MCHTYIFYFNKVYHGMSSIIPWLPRVESISSVILFYLELSAHSTLENNIMLNVNSYFKKYIYICITGCRLQHREYSQWYIIAI